MLGLPESPGAVGAAALLIGLVLGLATGARVLRTPTSDATVRLLIAVTAGVTVAAAPYTLWRIAEDVRYTSSLNADDRAGAGPIQTFLQPYLLDPAVPLIPEGATYYTVVSPDIRREARQGFLPLATNVLFPRVSVERPETADWILAWGVDPRSLGVRVTDVTTVRGEQAGYPAVRLARVR